MPEPAYGLPAIGTRLQFDDEHGKVKATVVGHDDIEMLCRIIYDDMDEGWTDWPDDSATVLEDDEVPPLVKIQIVQPISAMSVDDDGDTPDGDGAARKRKAIDDDDDDDSFSDDLSPSVTEAADELDPDDDDDEVEDDDVDEQELTLLKHTASGSKGRSSKRSGAGPKLSPREQWAQVGLPLTVGEVAIEHLEWRLAHAPASDIHPRYVCRAAPEGQPAPAMPDPIEVDCMKEDSCASQVILANTSAMRVYLLYLSWTLPSDTRRWIQRSGPGSGRGWYAGGGRQCWWVCPTRRMEPCSSRSGRTASCSRCRSRPSRSSSPPPVER